MKSEPVFHVELTRKSSSVRHDRAEVTTVSSGRTAPERAGRLQNRNRSEGEGRSGPENGFRSLHTLRHTLLGSNKLSVVYGKTIGVRFGGRVTRPRRPAVRSSGVDDDISPRRIIAVTLCFYCSSQLKNGRPNAVRETTSFQFCFMIKRPLLLHYNNIHRRHQGIFFGGGGGQTVK